MKKRNLLLIILLMLLFSGLLILSFYLNFDRIISEMNFKFIKSEVLYIIMFLIILIPLFLVFLVIGLFKRHDSIGSDTNVIIQNEQTKPKEKENGILKLSEAPLINIKKVEDEASIEPRFYMLNELDKKYKEYNASFKNHMSLEELCINFREYSSYKLKLYYSMDDIRRFIAGLSVTHILILQGMSGTGKTSLAYAFGEFLNNETTVIPIQPMWKERTDLIGYYNEFTKKFNESLLLQKLYEAGYKKDIYITVLDEMNIARVEYYFAEFLSLLELPNTESRYIDVVSDVWENDPVKLKNGQLHLPDNMYFIGTANNDDSTFQISDKVYDRAMVLNLDKKAEPFEGKPTKEASISYEYLDKLFEDARAKYKISKRNLRRISELDKYMIDTFRITFGNRIMKQIKNYVPVFVASGGNELDAIDDILSKKVMRKLESLNPVYVKSQVDNLINKIEDIFGENELSECKEYILNIEKNI